MCKIYLGETPVWGGGDLNINGEKLGYFYTFLVPRTTKTWIGRHQRRRLENCSDFSDKLFLKNAIKSKNVSTLGLEKIFVFFLKIVY